MDPRGVKGSWEAARLLRQQGEDRRIRKLAANAQWFEDHMPWDRSTASRTSRDHRPTRSRSSSRPAIQDRSRRSASTCPTTSASASSTAASRSRCPTSSRHATSAIPGSIRSEFSWTPEEAERGEDGRAGRRAARPTCTRSSATPRASRRRARSRASRRRRSRSTSRRSRKAGPTSSALYFMADPKLAELGSCRPRSRTTIARADYECYTRNALVQLRRVREGTQIEEDHMRNRQMVVGWLMANTKAIEVRDARRARPTT